MLSITIWKLQIINSTHHVDELAITPDGDCHVMTNVKSDTSFASASYSPLTKNVKSYSILLTRIIARNEQKANKNVILYLKFFSELFSQVVVLEISEIF